MDFALTSLLIFNYATVGVSYQFVGDDNAGGGFSLGSLVGLGKDSTDGESFAVTGADIGYVYLGDKFMFRATYSPRVFRYADNGMTVLPYGVGFTFAYVGRTYRLER